MKTIMERLSRVFSFTHTAILFLDKETQILNLDRMGGAVPAELLEKLQTLHIPLTEENSAFTIAVLKKAPFTWPMSPRTRVLPRGRVRKYTSWCQANHY